MLLTAAQELATRQLKAEEALQLLVSFFKFDEEDPTFLLLLSYWLSCEYIDQDSLCYGFQEQSYYGSQTLINYVKPREWTKELLDKLDLDTTSGVKDTVAASLDIKSMKQLKLIQKFDQVIGLHERLPP